MTKNLFEEFKLYETMWETCNKQSLQEIKRYVPPKSNKIFDIFTAVPDPKKPWYLEYFCIGPAYQNNKTKKIFTVDDLNYNLPDDNSTEYSLVPYVFCPGGYEAIHWSNIDAALDDIIDELGSSFSHIDTHQQLLDENKIYVSNREIIFITSNSSDIQDFYGMFARLSQKSLNSCDNLGQHLISLTSNNSPSVLAELLDIGTISSLSESSIFDKRNYFAKD